MAERNQQIDGLVIKRQNLGEADRILTIYSPTVGKVQVMARGVRRGKSKLAGHLEPFIETRINLARGHRLDVVTGAQGQKYYRLDTSPLEVITTAYLIIEMIDRLSPEAQANEQVYELVLQSLGGLADGLDYHLVKHYFFVKYLYLTGHQPNLAVDQAINQDKLFLRFDNGAIVGQVALGQPAEAISVEIIKLWRLIYGNDLAQVSRIGQVTSILPSAQELIERFYEYHLHTHFKSAQILH